MGFPIPRRIACTPAMKVVATAPIPGSRMPSLPFAGLTSTPFLRAMDLLQSGFGKLQIAPEPITFQGQPGRGDGNSSCRRFDISHLLTVHHRRKINGANVL